MRQKITSSLLRSCQQLPYSFCSTISATQSLNLRVPGCVQWRSTTSAAPPGPPSDTTTHSFNVFDHNFKDLVLARSATIPVIVVFNTVWCHPCDKLKPVIETMVRDRNGQILLAYLDVDSNAAVSKKYDVVAVPTVIGLFNGSVADKFVGTSSPELIEEFMQRLLELADGKNAEIKKK